eukprot:g3697.t1
MFAETTWFSIVAFTGIFHVGNVGERLLAMKYPIPFLLGILGLAWVTLWLGRTEALVNLQLKSGSEKDATFESILVMIIGGFFFIISVVLHLFLAYKKRGWEYVLVYLLQFVTPLFLIYAVIQHCEASPLKSVRKDNDLTVYIAHFHHYQVFGYISCFTRFPQSFASGIAQCLCIGMIVNGLAAYGPTRMFGVRYSNIDSYKIASLQGGYKQFLYYKGFCQG